MGRRILFFIRGKLGDSLVAYAAVRSYVDQFPDDDVTLAIRKNYARLIAGERGLRLLPFGSRLEMALRLLRLRLSPAFDALAVLWGFGSAVRLLGRLVRAQRRLAFDRRFAEGFPEWPELPQERAQLAAPAAVIRKLEPRYREPGALRIPSLAATRSPQPVIGVVPVADEPRRTMDVATLAALLKELRRRHPGHELWVLLSVRDVVAPRFLALEVPEHVRFQRFTELEQVVEMYRSLDAWYGTDTGLYHLAAAMEIPATLFFGPTQPWKVVMPAQKGVQSVRLAVLEDEHCEEKGCERPHCLHAAVAAFAGAAPSSRLADTPVACPLRAHPEGALAAIHVHENTGPQARQDR